MTASAVPPRESDVPDPGLAEARALADPTRAAIHRHVVRSSAPVTIAELVGATGLHHTAVRQHLAKLEAASLVSREVLPPEGRGRPRLAYRGFEHRHDQPYRLLAGMLADALRTGRTPREVGQDVGRELGRAAADAHRPPDPVGTVVAEARRLGFAPVVVEARAGTGVDGPPVTEIQLHACPYAELAATDPATVCSVHLGLAEGVAASVGGLVVDGLEPATELGGSCRFRVHRV